MENSDKDVIVNYTDQDLNTDNGISPQELKARNRMVAEGYKYSVLNEIDRLDPIEEKIAARQKTRRKRLLALLVFSIIVIVVMVIVIVYQQTKLSKSGLTCTNPECVKGAAYILNKMDPNVNPCDDFFLYSCGNWEKTTPIPPSKSKYGAFSQIYDEIEVILKEILTEEGNMFNGVNSTAVHKARSLYKMCNDVQQIEKAGATPALKLIKSLGSWTLTSDEVSGTFDASRWTLLDALLLTHRQNSGTLFSMSVSTDDKDNSRYIIGFEQSGLSLATKEYFPNHTRHDEIKTAYLKFGKDMLTLLGGSAEIKEKILDIYNFEQQLAYIHMQREELLDPVKNYHKMTLKKFQDDLLGEDFVNIFLYMKGMFGDILTLTEDLEVVVYTPAYFEKLGSLIKNTSQETLVNYMVWHNVEGKTAYLSQKFNDVALEYDKVVSGVKAYPDRWKRCVSKVQSNVGYAPGALYVQKYFDVDSKADVESVFEDIRAAFIDNLHSLPWMDDVTRNYAIEKAQAVKKMLGYPDFVNSPTELDKHYENLTLVAGDFFGSKIQLNTYHRQKNMWRYRETPDPKEWSMVPTEVNGYYSPDFNHIVFPAGILRPPLYNPASPKSFNYGSFGMICGHELTHGFDNSGRNFDKFGNMKDWWTNTSSSNFLARTKCFQDFYSNYTVDGTHLNGKTTLGENIADNGGMKTAFLALQAWMKRNGGVDSLVLPGMDYTPNQLFFIGMAQIWCSHYTPAYMQQAILTDPHSIAKFRVLGSMSNSEDFAKTFNCPINSPMNPAKKCNVW